MIKIIQTNDKSLPRRQDGWRNSSAILHNGVQCINQCNSNISDNEINCISDNINDQQNVPNQIPNAPIKDVKQFEIEKYVKDFTKQHGSILVNPEDKIQKSKVLLG